MSASGVVFRSLAGSGVFTETGVIYRRADASPILASFLHEVRATPPERAGSESASAVPQRKRPSAARGRARAKASG
jgi:hypothetical protein